MPIVQDHFVAVFEKVEPSKSTSASQVEISGTGFVNQRYGKPYPAAGSDYPTPIGDDGDPTISPWGYHLRVFYSAANDPENCRAKAEAVAANNRRFTIIGEGTVIRYVADCAPPPSPVPGTIDSINPRPSMPTYCGGGAIVQASKIIACWSSKPLPLPMPPVSPDPVPLPTNSPAPSPQPVPCNSASGLMCVPQYSPIPMPLPAQPVD
jgi:hypothetical protein